MKHVFSQNIIIFIMTLLFITPSLAYSSADINAVTYLNETNVLGLPDKAHWDIIKSGTYIMNYSPEVINTNNNYAVSIYASNVIFDGNGKTITGPSKGTVESGPSYYGIKVNTGSGVLIQNVTVKNVVVSNKNFGVKYEYVYGGGISSSQLASNYYGIYTWKSSNLNIESNTANSNEFGIVLGSENDYFTIYKNIVNSNVNNGIYLSLSNNHNVISNNQVNNNNMGIVLTDEQTGASGSGTDNTISGNTISGNQNGIFLRNYHSNRITSNSLSGNMNVGVWLLGTSSSNQFTGNYVQESGWLGIYLSNKVNGNVFYNNVFKNGLALNSDSNYGSDGTVFNNQWNITPVTGVNIVGGSSIGGNYWSNPSYTGFSSTHLDNDFDGFCDQQYLSQSDLIDNYPLHILTESINTVRNLDETNVLGLPDNAHWDIIKSGTYILTYSPEVINTNNNYAVRIYASNVIFDGKGKTITGPSIGTVESGPSYYGIRVNSGSLTQNVTVKNVVVSNKYFGVIYEYVQRGEISSSQFASNYHGIYTWKSSNLNIRSNTANSNTYGIELDADQSTNDYYTIDSNIVNSNVNYGIYLWLSNNHNVISNNQVNNNKMGIVLTDGKTGASGSGTDNTISGNTVNGNQNGIFLSNYNGNRITGNSLSGNTNVSVWLLGASSGNQFTGNHVQESGWRGIYLSESANRNIFYDNVFKNGRALNPDENYSSDGTVSNNQWNITPVAGVNIVGGSSIGGNYWSNPSSTGFSDTHSDSNLDGFSDQPYNPSSELIDQYPLHIFKVTPSISLNGSSLTLQLNAGDNIGKNADWWFVALSPSGHWFSYAYPNRWNDIGTDLSQVSPAYQGPLADISSLVLFDTTGIPSGNYVFYFGVDTNMNGVLDYNQLYYSSLPLTSSQ